MIMLLMGIFEKAQIDFLTGFFLRQSLGPFLEKAMRDATATNGLITLALVDLDHFKKYNDKYGHDCGDDILKFAASTLRLTMDENQTYFFRYGGDEFIVVFVGKSAKESAQLLRSCRHNMLHRPFLSRNRFIKVTMSIGLASYPHDASTMEELITRADGAMYYSKKHGRNRITQWSGINRMRSRNILIVAGALLVIAALCVMAILRMGLVKDNLAPILNKLERLILKGKAEAPDTVILKNGTVFEGKIVVEDGRMVMLKLDQDKGKDKGKEKEILRLDKSKISKIKYGAGR